MQKKKKILLISGLSSLLLLASCGQNGTESSSIESSQESSSQNDQLVLRKALNSASKGVAVESLVSITTTYSTTGGVAENYYAKFYLDTQSTTSEFAYQQYEEVDSLTSTPTKDTLYSEGYLTKNVLGYACNTFLSIDNTLYSSPITQTTSAGTSYVSWGDSFLDNVFDSLKAAMFEKESENVYILKEDTEQTIKRHISGNFYGSNTLPAAKEFKLTLENGEVSKYSLVTEVQSRVESSYNLTYTVQYSFEGTFIGIGKDNENVTKNFIYKSNDKEDETLSAAIESLQDNNYTEESTIYSGLSSSSLKEEGTFVSKTTSLYAGDSRVSTVTDSAGKVSETSAYYVTKENYLQEIVKVGDNYYNQGLALSNSDGSKPFPQFGISSIFFKKEKDNYYTYTYGYKNCELFMPYTFADNVSGIITSAAIDLTVTGKITISAVYLLSQSDTSGSTYYYYYKIVNTYSNIGTTTNDVVIANIADGDNLTWNDYFKDDEYLPIAKNILGEEILNSIPVLGGYYNDVTLYASEKDRTVQMQYRMGSLNDFDFDGDSSLSTTEQAYLYYEVNRTLRPYSAKIDDEKWPNLKAGLLSGTQYCIELTSTKSIEENLDLVLDVFFTYNQYTYDTYIVIEAKYNEYITVTFDLNYEGAENITKKATKGGKVSGIDVERKGYMFGGWYTDKECTKSADFSKALEGDTTFYAKWIAY